MIIKSWAETIHSFLMFVTVIKGRFCWPSELQTLPEWEWLRLLQLGAALVRALSFLWVAAALPWSRGPGVSETQSSFTEILYGKM